MSNRFQMMTGRKGIAVNVDWQIAACKARPETRAL
jgi:hypothetical protein